MLTENELKFLVGYNSGGCLCGHGESCSVCSRSDDDRKFIRLSKELAKEILTKAQALYEKNKNRKTQ